MDIEAFYEQNEARRESAEFEFGSEWTDASDNEYELSWVEATGELYLMVEPEADVNEDMFGDFFGLERGRERPHRGDYCQSPFTRWLGGSTSGLGRRDARGELALLALRSISSEITSSSRATMSRRRGIFASVTRRHH